MSQSTRPKAEGKPDKPYNGFPLFAHRNGQWCKKLKGRQHYFGVWSDPNGALERFLDQRDDLMAGRIPRVQRDGLSLAELCNRYLEAKDHLVSTGELTYRTFVDCRHACQLAIEAFGRTRVVKTLIPDDFDEFRKSLSNGRGPVAVANQVRRVRSIFKYGFDSGMLDTPMRFGATFKQPSRRILRKERQARGKKMFEADELRQIIEAASQPLRAMVMLGANVGFGNSDVGNLPLSALDLDSGWIDFPRPKTAVERRVPLWPETIASIREAIKSRPNAKDDADAGLVFITKYGTRWAKDNPASPLSAEMRKHLDRLGLHRPGLGFYGLRHTFETIGGEARDQIAVNAIMGHADATMSAVYRERISDERLIAVTDHVRKWLWPSGSSEEQDLDSSLGRDHGT